jgi:hypothetical protein
MTNRKPPEESQPTLPGMDRTEPKEPRPTPAKTGDELRDEGIERAIRNAGEDWKAAALAVLWTTAKRLRFLFSDDYWNTADAMQLPPPPDGRAWGAVLREGRRRGWIVHTGEWTKTKRPHCHSGDCKIYLSKIWEGKR